MANKTDRCGFNVFLENDIVNFDEINYNFEKLDTMNLCVESGTASATYNGVTSGSIIWRYKKYADKTVELSAKLELGSIRCNGGSSAPYSSGEINVYFPFKLSNVYNIQMHMTSNTVGWVHDMTPKGVLDCVSFKAISMALESANVYKEISINVKGVLA